MPISTIATLGAIAAATTPTAIQTSEQLNNQNINTIKTSRDALPFPGAAHSESTFDIYYKLPNNSITSIYKGGLASKGDALSVEFWVDYVTKVDLSNLQGKDNYYLKQHSVDVTTVSGNSPIARIYPITEDQITPAVMSDIADTTATSLKTLNTNSNVAMSFDVRTNDYKMTYANTDESVGLPRISNGISGLLFNQGKAIIEYQITDIIHDKLLNKDIKFVSELFYNAVTKKVSTSVTEANLTLPVATGNGATVMTTGIYIN